MRKRVFILLSIIFNIVLSVSSYAEVKNVIPEELQTDKPEITISLDPIEYPPEKLTEYGIKHSEVRSGTIQCASSAKLIRRLRNF